MRIPECPQWPRFSVEAWEMQFNNIIGSARKQAKEEILSETREPNDGLTQTQPSSPDRTRSRKHLCSEHAMNHYLLNLLAPNP